MKKHTCFIIVLSTCFLFFSSQLQAQSLEKQSLQKRKQLTVKHDAQGRPHVEGIVRKFKTSDTSSLKKTSNKESNIDVEMERFNKDDYEVSDPQALDAAMQRVDDSGYPMMENAYSRMAEEETTNISIKKISGTNFISKPALNQKGIK